MPLWFIELAIIFVFAPPIMLCLVVLGFGDLIIKYFDEKGAKMCGRIQERDA